MKEKVPNLKKKETDTEMLARMMKQGFDRMDERFEDMDKRFDGVDKRFDKVEERLGYVENEVVSLNKAQDETNRRLTSIERKQTGVLSSLDNTVTRKEFQVLASRVTVLEKK